MTTSTEEIYNKVSEHLLSMQNPSRNAVSGQCMYRGPNGSKCAVGCLIKDEFYNKNLEHISFGFVGEEVNIAVEESINRQLTENEIDMLVALQSLHDFFGYWLTDSGLNKQGKDRLLKIKEEFVECQK